MDVQGWSVTMNGHQAEYSRLVGETERLALRMQSQIDKKILSEDEEFKSRDFLMDRAYEALVVFVEDLLKYTDGTAEIGSGGVPSLPIVVQCFKSLAEYCEKVIDEEGLQAVEATQEIGEDGQVVEQINSLRTKLQSDMNGLRDAVSSAETYFNEVHGHHMIAREELRNAEERKEGFFYSAFGDSDIDNAVNGCRSNENNWHNVADEAWKRWDDGRNIHSNFQPLFNCNLDVLVKRLGEMADRVRLSYSDIGIDRKIDNDCWIAARTLQYHVTTNTEYTSRDDALRHVIKLLHTANTTIDGDSDVAQCKDRMKKLIQDKLGADVAAMLEGEKVYLTKPEDVDF